MIVWFTAVQLAVALLAGLLCVGLGLAGRKPSDLSIGAVALVEVLLLVQLGVAILAPAMGNEPVGNMLEFYTYLISALILPPAAAFWALVDRSRWSTVILGTAALAIAVMVYRMQEIWTTPIG
jgi:hypothetical protein